MFLLHWFDLQRDYINFYTADTAPVFCTTKQGRSKSKKDPHKTEVPRERPEPAQRDDHWKNGQTYPGYPYFIGELFPAFGLAVHETRLPNGIQHKTCGMNSARNSVVGNIATIDLEIQVESQVTEFLKEKNPGLVNNQDARKQVRANIMQKWGKAEGESRQAEARSAHTTGEQTAPANRRATVQTPKQKGNRRK